MEIPEPSKIFYVKIDWYKDGMEVVLIQAYDSVEARKLETQ